MYVVGQGTCISDLPTFQPSNPDCQYFSLCIRIVSLDTHTLHTLHLPDERVWMSRAGKHCCSFMGRQSSFNLTTARRTCSVLYFVPAGRGLYNLMAWSGKWFDQPPPSLRRFQHVIKSGMTLMLVQRTRGLDTRV